MSDETQIKLNLGAGRWKREGWTTIDRAFNPDITLDFSQRSKWPFKKGSVALIFCSHVLEHLTDSDGLRLLKTAFALLKPGGRIRVVVPDLEAAAANAQNIGFFYDAATMKEIALEGNSAPRRLASWVARYTFKDAKGKTVTTGPNTSNASIFEALKKGLQHFVEFCVAHIPQDAVEVDHRNGYWQEKLKSTLEEAGFSDVRLVYKYGMKPVPSPESEFDHKDFFNRPVISLVMEAGKAAQE